MLARDLGKTVEELLETLTGAEYTYWAALYSIEAKEQERANKKLSKGSRK
jgi:hypothetical protein